MVFKETGVQAHFYLWFTGAVLFLIFLGYAFVYEHKNNKLSNEWKVSFMKHGLTKKQIDGLSHDGDIWYYNAKSTCVGYGGQDEKCPQFESVCSGGKTFGNVNQQVINVIKAISSDELHPSLHPECPLI